MPAPINEFQPFGNAGGANVMSQAGYAALPARNTGFVAGTALSAQLNKVWRQAAMVTAALMQHTVNLLGTDALDDGNFNNLVARIAATIAASGIGSYGSVGTTGVNNAGTPNTKYDLAAAQITLRNPANGTVVVLNAPASVTNDIGAVGPVAGGRDQAAAFLANTWVYFYRIYNPTTATLSSLSSVNPPATGPAALPAGYTHWEFATAVRLDAAIHLVPTYTRGSKVTRQVGLNVLTGGAASTATPTTAISVSAAVPAGALDFTVFARNKIGPVGGPGGSTVLNFGIASGAIYTFMPPGQVGTNETDISCSQLTLPNVGQQMYYGYNGGAFGGLDVDVLSYTVANGG